jgi:hypothetical protein
LREADGRIRDHRHVCARWPGTMQWPSCDEVRPECLGRFARALIRVNRVPPG